MCMRRAVGATYLTAAEAYSYDAEIVPAWQEFGLYLGCGSHCVLQLVSERSMFGGVIDIESWV